MKTKYYNFVLFTLVCVVALSLNLSAQEKTNLSKKEKAILNLKSAINSDNIGLRKSGYEMCAKFKYDELLPDLINASYTEEDDYLQFVLALTLLEFDTDDAQLKAQGLLSANNTIKALSKMNIIEK